MMGARDVFNKEKFSEKIKILNPFGGAKPVYDDYQHFCGNFEFKSGDLLTEPNFRLYNQRFTDLKTIRDEERELALERARENTESGGSQASTSGSSNED